VTRYCSISFGETMQKNDTGRMFEYDFNHTTIRRDGITYHAKGHSDHFHVKIGDPDGTNN